MSWRDVLRLSYIAPTTIENAIFLQSFIKWVHRNRSAEVSIEYEWRTGLIRWNKKRKKENQMNSSHPAVKAFWFMPTDVIACNTNCSGIIRIECIDSNTHLVHIAWVSTCRVPCVERFRANEMQHNMWFWAHDVHWSSFHHCCVLFHRTHA